MSYSEKQARCPHLSDDILVMVFSRLPMKSILRFKCVCKAWKDLISNPLHRKALSLTMSGFFYHTSDCPRDQQDGPTFVPTLNGENVLLNGNLDFLPDLSERIFDDCCNGLVLCRLYYYQYYVCNPATKRWVVVPKAKPKYWSQSYSLPILFAKLVFDPLVSPHFKIICILRRVDDEGRMNLIPEIFSSKTRQWIVVGELLVNEHLNFQYLGEQICHGNAVVVKDSLYILLRGSRHVIKFDTKEERFSVIDLPEHVNAAISQCLGESGGCLHYACRNKYDFRVWILNNDNNSGPPNNWHLKHDTSVQALVEQYYQVVHPPSTSYFHSIFTPLAFLPDLDVVILQLHSWFLFYNLNSRKLEEVWRKRGGYAYLGTFSVYPFSPCKVDYFSKAGIRSLGGNTH